MLALGYNFVWAPLIGLVLARVFLHDPLLALGFLLVMVVPCSSMSIAYTGLAKGDVELSTVIVGSSFVIAVVAVPAWMMIFAAGYDVPVPMGAMMGSILTVLIAPMLAGWLTRKVPVFSAASMLAMSAIIFLIFVAKAQMIIDRWQMVLLLLVPNALFLAVTLAAATWLNRRLGPDQSRADGRGVRVRGQEQRPRDRDRRDRVQPLVAVPAATMHIFQVLLMVGYLKIAPRVRTYYATNTHSRHAHVGYSGEAVTQS